MEKLPLKTEYKEKTWNEKIINILLVALTVFFMLAIVFNTVYRRIYVVGPSMRNTLIGAASPEVSGGDFVYVSDCVDADYGDIVIIKAQNRYLIKRVLAFGGDRVKLVDGDLFVNGKFVEEPYVSPENKVNVRMNNFEEIVVEKGYIFFLGDNRDNSDDSRGSFGCMPEESIEGVVVGWSLYYKDIITDWNTLLEFGVHTNTQP